MKLRKTLLGVTLIVAGGISLTGCGNLPSTSALMQQSKIVRTVDPQGLAAVTLALHSLDDVQNYQLKAQIQETTGRYTQSVDFYGTIVLPSQSAPSLIQMDETIGGNDFPVYQNGSVAYYRDGTRWQPMQPVTNLRPWDSLAKSIAKNPPHTVYRLPDQTVVSWLCHVYQFKAAYTGSQIGTASLTAPHEALYTVWVDKTDGLLRQIEVDSTIGVPDKGTGAIDATELFFNDNSPNNLQIKVPSDLVAQIEKP